MKDQRGSVTVIAVVMLLFLMIIAVAWLPMLTTEKTAAASDYREQQAWYAAEAGYKRAVAELEAGKSNVWDWLSSGDVLEKGTFDKKNILEIQETQTKAVESSAIWYAVAIDGINKDKTYSPEAGKTYAITSVGSCQGIRKVIRKDFTLGDDGGEEPEQPQKDIYLDDALVTSGGTVAIDFVNGDNSGKIYANGSVVANGFEHIVLVPAGKVKYYVQDIVFSDSYYKNISNNVNEELTDGSKVGIGASYYKSAKISGGNNNISVSGNSVLLTKEDIDLSGMSINVKSGVLQIVANGKVTLSNVKVTGEGQLTIIAKENLAIQSMSSDKKSRILLISNQIRTDGSTVVFNNPVVYKCFISAQAVTLKAPGKFVYEGQIQAAGAVKITGDQLEPQNFKLHFVKIAENLIFPPMK
ncbi:MAG: pilus assembly PilX N-terminal domain-containing protein [Phascolarctobacterium faecium]|uniref:pilus assembly PilX family protein n=1 Tax=Phascolarctobacterium faecium TaxID=33025 RepID=UPI002E7A252C|nr:pilus assembly PilX N-terminal domain-containing protein [Phascolarctobacterium faecium]MED9992575.1 pilus assembly PilX N-terminal domain-containing protein [Phascolarctobacterium faecium]